MKKPANQKKAPAAKKQPEKMKIQLTPPASRAANRYLILFFFLWALILYGNTILNKYAVDDEYVTNNEQVKQGFKAIPAIFKSYYVVQKGNVSSQVSDYRPVVKATFAIEYALYGEKPGRSHALNIFIYFLLSTALFFVLKRLLKSYNILFPFLITVVFMAHPVHTEVVASLKNRDEMLAFLFAILSLHYLLKFADTKKVLYIFVAALLYAIGYLAKTSILPFIALYPLVLYFFTDLKPKTYIPVVLGIVVAAALAHYLPRLLVLPPAERISSFVENPLYFDKSLWHRLGTGFIGLLFYLRILVYPHPLLYYYGYNTIPYDNLGNIWAILSILIYAGLFIYAVLKLREKHLLSFAILWFLIAISMYSNILIPVVGIVGERFVFVGSVAFCLALVWFIFRIFRTDPKSLTIEFDSRAKILVVIGLIIIPYTAMTVTRNREWRNMFDLLRKDIPYLENSAKANTQFAGFLMNSVYQDPNFKSTGNVNMFKKELILEHFLRSLEIYPNQYQTINDLGTVYLYFDKNPDSAIIYLNKAVALKPDLIPAWVNLGMSYREKGEYNKAIECYDTILQKRPGEIRAIFALANIYNDMGDFNRAVQMNEEVIQKFPELDMPYINLGNYYIQRGDTAAAVKNWEIAVSKRPTYEGAMQLNYLYKMHGDQQKADFYLQMAQQLMNQQTRR
jgi:tetratricopeptide (TPR) repeat protein